MHKSVFLQLHINLWYFLLILIAQEENHQLMWWKRAYEEQLKHWKYQ